MYNITFFNLAVKLLNAGLRWKLLVFPPPRDLRYKSFQYAARGLHLSGAFF